MRTVLVFLTFVSITMSSCHGDYYDMGDGYIYLKSADNFSMV